LSASPIREAFYFLGEMMKKIYLNLIVTSVFLCLLTSCVSSGGSSVSTRKTVDEIAFWDRTPNGSQLIFIGVGAFRSNRDEAIRLAVENAARQVAIFYRAEGSFKMETEIGGGFLDYRADTTTSLRFDESYVKYVDGLEYDVETDVREHENAIFVRTRYSAPFSIVVPFKPSVDGGKPEWATNPPSEMGAYAVSIGHAGRRSQHRDTVNASHENAILAIIRERSSDLKSVNTSKETNNSSIGETKSSLSASGVVQNFYILEIWTDPKDKSVWTLGIVPK
jgi:hypothetical protein